MDTTEDLDGAFQQISRAARNGISLSAARLGPAPVLSYDECRKLSHETAYSMQDLRSEFIGFKDGWEDFREAMEDLKREIGKPCLRITNWLFEKLER